MKFAKRCESRCSSGDDGAHSVELVPTQRHVMAGMCLRLLNYRILRRAILCTSGGGVTAVGSGWQEVSLHGWPQGQQTPVDQMSPQVLERRKGAWAVHCSETDGGWERKKEGYTHSNISRRQILTPTLPLAVWYEVEVWDGCGVGGW